jgi:hypothetical protein
MMDNMADALFDALYDPENDYGDDRGVACKYCGQEYLIWVNLGNNEKPKWRLTEQDGKLHECLSKKVEW